MKALLAQEKIMLNAARECVSKLPCMTAAAVFITSGMTMMVAGGWLALPTTVFGGAVLSAAGIFAYAVSRFIVRE